MVKDVPLGCELSDAVVTLNDAGTLVEDQVCLPLFVDVGITDEFRRVAAISPIHPAHRQFELCSGSRGQVAVNCQAVCPKENLVCHESRVLANLPGLGRGQLFLFLAVV